ncbi:MAG: tyrosine-type recombinase/integrase [Candidatus Dormibacteria bacterium]
MPDGPRHLRPKAPRRDYYSPVVVSEPQAASAFPRPGSTPTIQDAAAALIRYHATDWATTTRRNARLYLQLNRFPAFCEDRGLSTIDQLTTARIHDFLADISGVLKPETVAKYRIYLRALARFCTATPGYGDGLADVDRIPPPRLARNKLPVALTKEQEQAVVAAAAQGRDRLIVQTLLACGLRVSELCALLVPDLNLAHRPPFVRVRGTAHDRDITKSGEDRNVPFRTKYASLPKDLLDYVSAGRDAEGHAGARLEVFLSQRRGGLREWAPLTPSGVEQLMDRIGARAKVHCNPHRLRHTWATRCVEAGVPMFHLQQAGGWRSIEMVRRYYSADARTMLEAFAHAYED